MKLRTAGIPVLAVMTLLALSGCDQAPVFTTISNETAPADALIKGNPSDIVSYLTNATDTSERLWVANGYIWTYDGYTATWSKVDRPGSNPVRQLASTGTALYALTVGGGDATETAVYRTTDTDPSDGVTWTEVTNGSATYTHIMNIHAANGVLFAGATEDVGTSGPFGVLYCDSDTGSLAETDMPSLATGGEFIGVAYASGYYYLATTTKGIYWSTTAGSTYSSTNVISISGYQLTGIMTVGLQFVAVGKNSARTYGYLCYGDYTGITHATQNDYLFSGALGLYAKAPATSTTADYLLLGVDEDDDYDYGYVAVALSSGEIASTTIKSIGDGVTVDDSDQYDTSLRVIPVYSIHQFTGVSGAKNIIFASTGLEGLWDCTDGGDWAAVDK